MVEEDQEQLQMDCMIHRPQPPRMPEAFRNPPTILIVSLAQPVSPCARPQIPTLRRNGIRSRRTSSPTNRRG